MAAHTKEEEHAFLEVTHQGHYIAITLLLFVRATYMGAILRARPVRGESHIQRHADHKVATVLIAVMHWPINGNI